MNKNLVRTIDSCTVDNLIAKLSPAAETFGIKIRKEASAETTYKRGTIHVQSGQQVCHSRHDRTGSCAG